VPQPADRLGLDAFVREAETTPEQVARLIEIGAILPVDGTFGPGDVVRSRLLDAFVAAGIDLDHIAIGIRERAMTLEFVDLFYPAPSPRTGRSFADLAADIGERGELLGPALAAMGLPSPAPDAPTRVRDEAVLRSLVDAWSVAGPEVTIRAARTMGDSMRRAAEAWVALFDEAVSRPLNGRSPSFEELEQRVVAPATRINYAAHELIPWVFDRHLERTMTELDVEALERELATRGLVVAEPEHPPAIAFVDVSGYTRLTEEWGDDAAVRIVVRLGELAETAARSNDGRVVKLLGDGVLLAFEHSAGAVAASLDIETAMRAARLPPTHAGIHAGGLIVRDGDVYGATVNVAARVAGHADAGEVVVTDVVRAEAEGAPAPTGVRFEPVGEATLKGVAAPVSLFRAIRDPATG
jgi:class 3 adenylate cyclase